MSRMWRSLEALGGQAGVAAIWQPFFDGDFEVFKGAFLRAKETPALSVPCPQECGCWHEVVCHDDGRMVGVCRCDPWNCDNIALTPADVVVFQLNWSKLGRALARAFDCEPNEIELGPRFTRQVGSFSGATVPVILTIQSNPRELRSVVAELVAGLHRPFILFSPTNRHIDFRSQELLANCGAGFFGLDSHVTLLPNGTLQACRSGGELFAHFLPADRKALAGDIGQPVARYLFSLSGNVFRVVFDGQPEFHLSNTLGTRYLDYLLHHPNVPIAAFDLEVAIRPGRSAVRSKDSIQRGLDPDAVKSYLRELDKLRAQCEEASEDGDEAEVSRMEKDMAEIEEALKGVGQVTDTGERARNNVRKAIAAVLEQLKSGGLHEKGFGEHIQQFVDTGYECMYNQPQGGSWQ
jgi:hypothetical protein